MALDFLKKLTRRSAGPKQPVRESAPETELQAPTPTVTVPAPSNPALKSFLVSEKATRNIALNQYTFLVDQHATKTQVRDAVERGYHVDVVSVQMIRLPSKQRTLGRITGRVPGKKKAVVVLKTGQSIAAAQP